MRDDVIKISAGEKLSDEALAVLVARGDEVALGDLYDRYQRPVFSMLLRMVRDRHAAEDLAQEVFLRVWQRARTYDPHMGRFSGWIFQIAHRAALDEIRRRNARPCQVRADPARSPCLPDVPDSAPGPEELCVMGDHREGIVGALSRLPAVQRETIELAYFGGLTQAEIAEHSATPIGTIKTRCKLALRKLRGYLEAQGVRSGTL